MNTYFALNTPKIETDPALDNLFLGFMGLILLIGLVILAWRTFPIVYDNMKLRRIAKAKEANSIWYDSKEAELHCGYKQVRIEPKSLEHFVCKITFVTPNKYIGDTRLW